MPISTRQLTEVQFDKNDLTGDALGGAGADVLDGCKRLKVVGLMHWKLNTSELLKGIMVWCRKSFVFVNLAGL